jgi:hypothetical protein
MFRYLAKAGALDIKARLENLKVQRARVKPQTSGA